jgi:sphinganine-1-phosphate aldolase
LLLAEQGSSVIMYKDATLRTYQYYVNPDWPGSCYISSLDILS